MFTATQYASGTDETPSTNPADIGAAFQPQSRQGSYGVDFTDDRVDYLSGDADVNPQMVSAGQLGNPNDSEGKAAMYGGSIFGGLQYGNREDEWYDTLRPQAGFPLPLASDTEEANRTSVYASDIVNEPSEPNGAYSTDGHRITERSFNEPSRVSAMPAEIQPSRPWDIVMGAFPWTGTKVTMQSPTAASPQTFASPLLDAIPSPTGMGTADTPSYYLNPNPLTFRTPPEPWDTGSDGFYVDSGA